MSGFSVHIVNGLTWIRGNGYWILDIPQKSQIWLDARKGRITMSAISAAAQNEQYPFRYKTKEQAVGTILGTYRENHTPEAVIRMSKGVVGEPIARKWYERHTGRRVKEFGIAIPDFNPFLGASPDGVIVDENDNVILSGPENGCIEIKCPENMYPNLMRSDNVPVPSLQDVHAISNAYEKFYSHIHRYQYDQMQGCMAVLRKDWCDFVVFAIATKKIYLTRVYFDPQYWFNNLYIRACSTISSFIAPVIGSPPIRTPNVEILNS